MNVVSNDGAGLAGLFGQHRAELARFLNARCGDSGDAEDLLQELWIKASGQPAGPIANPRAYLFRMANNLVLDRLRGQRRAMARDREWIDTDGPAPGEVEDRVDPSMPADEALARKQEAALVRKAIAALPPGAQRALQLCRIEGRKLEEAAGILGISRSGVEKNLALAMKRLRSELIDCGLVGTAASNTHEAPNRGAWTPVEFEQ